VLEYCERERGHDNEDRGTVVRSTMKRAAKSKRPAAGRSAARKRRPSLSPERLLQLGCGFWGPRTLFSAVELGLFTVLASGALDETELRKRLGLHPRAAKDFFDALVALGPLQRKGGKYRNAADADAFLDRAKPGYIGGLLEMAAARLYPFWGSLTEALRTGAPQNEAKSGGDFFRDPLPSADVIVMGHVLHDWNLEEKHLLLQKAYAALPKRGALIVYDAITSGGFDYTPSDCRGWMKAAGYRKTAVVPLTPAESMVIATK
jgi:O-methyltransferase domain/Dimerisation domain